ncbi:MAG TPA: hypothetical protein VFQ53_28535 [Kofleriaceae bacterium]|nr:hypothetical protein [Kofleriaceae bacterium]
MRPLALVVVVVVACHREPVAQEPVPLVMHPRTEQPAPVLDDDAGAPPLDVEVTARIADAKVDAKAGTTIVTIGVGQNQGIEPTWVGQIIDDAGTVLGPYTIVEVKPRTTIGASALQPKQLEGKRVRLTSQR